MRTRLFAIPVLAVFFGGFDGTQNVRADGPPVAPMPQVILPPADFDLSPPPSPIRGGAGGEVPSAPAKAAKKLVCPFLAHLLHPHSWGCGSDPYNPGCSSCEDECIFLFGSCRQFYGEPCYKKSPPPLAWYGIHP